MKAKIKSTGEIVDVISYSGNTQRTDNDIVNYIDSKGIEHSYEKLNYYWDMEEIEGTNSIDWEKRRYEIAKSAMNGLLSSNQLTDISSGESCNGQIIWSALFYADELIKQLKNKNESNED